MPTLKKAAKQRMQPDVKRKDRQDIYNTTRWRKLRESYLMTHPVCELCEIRGSITPASQVHHMDTFLNYTGQGRLNKAYDWENLIALCPECHSFIHKHGVAGDQCKEDLFRRIGNLQK